MYMTDAGSLQTWAEGPIAYVQFNRPAARNALNNEMMVAAIEAVATFNEDPNLLVIVLSGAGETFSAGFDLKASGERDLSTVDKVRAQMTLQFDFITAFWTSRKPTIAMVQGYCLAGAFEASLACDLTIAADNAMFGEPEVRFGTGAVAMLFPWITGPKQAKEIMLTGADRIDATDALRMGLVNKVVPLAALEQTTRQFAERITRASSVSVQRSKEAINRAYDIMGMREALAMGLDIDVEINTTPSFEKSEFARIRKAAGLKAAIQWRDGRFETS